MIAKLRGKMDEIGTGWAVIDCGGVGYFVQASLSTLQKLPPAGDNIVMWVHTEMREAVINLYGFVDPHERDGFRLLIRVQGVGPRAALSILSVLEPDALYTALVAQDDRALSRAEGIGPKLARRIIAELKDSSSLSVFAESGLVIDASRAESTTPKTEKISSAVLLNDVVSALVNLGLGRSEAHSAAVSAQKLLGPEASLEKILQQGLKNIAPSEE